MKIMFLTTHEDAVEEVYTGIKERLNTGEFNTDDVSSLAELTTELANRLKEESSGE